jgi:hypothetical protein
MKKGTFLRCLLSWLLGVLIFCPIVTFYLIFLFFFLRFLNAWRYIFVRLLTSTTEMIARITSKAAMTSITVSSAFGVFAVSSAELSASALPRWDLCRELR